MQAGVTRVWERPLIVADVKEKKKKKKKKFKYSRRWKDFQKLERRLAKENRRVSRAYFNGAKYYLRRRDKSARKKKDGALKDMFQNTSRTAFRTMGKVAPSFLTLPKVAFSFYTGKGVRRQFRRILPFKGFTKYIPFF